MVPRGIKGLPAQHPPCNLGGDLEYWLLSLCQDSRGECDKQTQWNKVKVDIPCVLLQDPSLLMSHKTHCSISKSKITDIRFTDLRWFWKTVW